MYSVSTNVIIVLDFQHFWEVLILLNEFVKLILPLICWLAIWCKLMSVCNWPLILITPVCVYQGPLACSMVWLIIKIKLVFFSYRYRTDWKYICSINILEWNVFCRFSARRHHSASHLFTWQPLWKAVSRGAQQYTMSVNLNCNEKRKLKSCRA